MPFITPVKGISGDRAHSIIGWSHAIEDTALPLTASSFGHVCIHDTAVHGDWSHPVMVILVKEGR